MRGLAGKLEKIMRYKDVYLYSHVEAFKRKLLCLHYSCKTEQSNHKIEYRCNDCNDLTQDCIYSIPMNDRTLIKRLQEIEERFRKLL